MLVVIAILWLGVSGLHAVAGLRGVMWVFMTVVAFVGISLIGGGVVEMARSWGIEIYGHEAGDQDSFYGYFLLVCLMIAGTVSAIEVKKAGSGEKRPSKKRRKMKSFALWRK